MLEAEGICKAYGRRRILENLDLRADAGECVGILGSNGCGKTTLLSILAGAQRPDKGRILLGGQDTAGRPEVFSRQAAYVPQENPLMEELSVRDNLLLWHRGSRKELERDLAEGPAAMLGVSSMLRQRAGHLSGGMKKRVSIGCALAAHPPILILDEPSAALDLICKEDIRGYLKWFQKNGGTILITTHEEAELDLCNRLYILRKGKLREENPALRGERLVQAFV